MKKQFAALLTALSFCRRLRWRRLLGTPPEIREQAKDGWHRRTPIGTGGKYRSI